MIPKQLALEGFYSYQKRQTIDFTELTDAGLFGIFGATGSGKSSILEAISYALYGQSERLNARDKRTYNMMNLKSDKAFVAFDFYNHENDLYRVTREFKRNSKNFEEVRTPKVVFYKYTAENWIPLEHTNAEEIVGLPYKHFKRTIIIPQGQFREFLELGARDRTQMMKDIFRLEQFDLQDKVSQLNKENDSKLNRVEGRLQGYEEITEEALKSKQKDLNEAGKEQSKKGEEHELINEKFQRLKHLKSDFESLQRKQTKFKSLKGKKENIENRKAEVDEYERIYKAFYQDLVELKTLKKEQKKQIGKKEALKNEVKKTETHLRKKENELSHISDYFEKLDEKKIEADDLEFILQILAYQEQIGKLEKHIKTGKDYVKKAEKAEDKSKREVERKKEEIKKLNSQRLDGKLLREVGEWFNKTQAFNENRQAQEDKIKKLKTEIQDLSEGLKKQDIDLEGFGDYFESKQKTLNQKAERLNKQKADLNVHQKLREHANALHDGEACPLCGSLEHPRVLEDKDVSREINTLDKQLESIEGQKERLQNKKSKVDQYKERKKVLKENLKAEKEQLSIINTNFKAHQNTFVWDDFKADNFTAFQEKVKASDKLEEKLKAENDALEELREKKERARAKVNKADERLNDIKTDERTKQTQIETAKSNLKHLKFSDYRESSVENVQKNLTQLKKENKKVEKQHKSLSDEINNLKPKISSEASTLNSYKTRIEELARQISDLEGDIERNLTVFKLEGIESVRMILKKAIKVEEERKEIQDFTIKYNTLKNSISELQEKLGETDFSRELFQKTQEKWETSSKELKQIEKKVNGLQTEIKRLTTKLEEKKILRNALEKHQKRAENLKTLFNLFKGAGFVEYVSSIYLSQLCDHANQRFQRMTRNQLSLRLNEKNDFEIIDHLNEGRNRSVKTLSGGQAFQVSLSLALALAESVQSNAKADKNFFFIDEGFGTQDAESINIIFETLLNLNKENKIVGIISHVEELKDRIPQALTIVKDEEEGSRIRVD